MGWNHNIKNGPLFYFEGGPLNKLKGAPYFYKFLLFFFYRTIFIIVGTLFPDTIPRWFNRVETKISEINPYFPCQGGGGNI